MRLRGSDGIDARKVHVNELLFKTSFKWPKKVSHYQIIKKLCVNRIKVCQ